MGALEGGKPVIRPAGRARWRAWLARNHATAAGVWLVIARKAATGPGVRYEDAVEEALCHGWIDSRAHSRDSQSFLLWMAPRKKGSVWSRINTERVKRLAAAGLMTPAGQAKVAAAKRDGSWTRLKEVEALAVPADLQAALAADPQACRSFSGFPASARKIILHWIQSARRPQTRGRRIAQTVELAHKNLRAGHPRR
jgi:uncharacterized protein YdeI (YjbR/CyaY-like superfamily)